MTERLTTPEHTVTFLRSFLTELVDAFTQQQPGITRSLADYTCTRERMEAALIAQERSERAQVILAVMNRHTDDDLAALTALRTYLITRGLNLARNTGAQLDFFVLATLLNDEGGELVWHG